MLTEYQQIFQVPTTLPPPRSHDHQINLDPGTRLVNVRPYQYPHIQKNEIERAVKEMLATGIIQPSTNPFTSPMLLVKKKDGSWRFCVDYCALNQVTVKDRYPIPIIDELLDKLHGAFYFTKLDLKSGYNLEMCTRRLSALMMVITNFWQCRLDSPMHLPRFNH